VDDGALGLSSRRGASRSTNLGAATGRQRVAIVGGGYAGFATAVALARAGVAVTVFEQARTLGGRARRVAVSGLALDNGQHLAIGAYGELLSLLAIVHGAARVDALFARLPLTLAPFGRAAGDAVALAAWPLPSPLHVGAGILAARGLSWRERFALAADFRRLARARFRCPAGQTVAECFATTPRRAFDAVWSPLCLAALNTPPDRASAQLFATVLGETLSGPAAGSDFLIPACDLSTLFPEPAAGFVAANGGEVRSGTTVRGLAQAPGGIAVATRNGSETFAAVVAAVGPHQLAGLVAPGSGEAADPWRPALAQVAKFGWESITTAWLAYPTAVTLPAPIARLDDAPGQWVFDRSRVLAGVAAQSARSLLAVVISGGGPHDREDHPALAARIDAQLRRFEPALPAPVWSKVIAERRATYACAPALPRPLAGRVAPGLYLAGDYTAADLPPTLEAAVRSGTAAAKAALEDLDGSKARTGK
jgi:hydroxysqualene dehydroxylase